MHWTNFESRNLCCLQSFEVKTHMKFLSLLKQILSFCSTNVVKVQVSSILTEKKNIDATRSIWTRSARTAVLHPNH